MSESFKPVAVLASEAPMRTKPSNYPEPFASMMSGREKRPLGDLFGLTNFGVNLTRMAPGAVSALRHAHSTQDEFIYVLSGQPTLVTNAGETLLSPGMCAGFKAGSGDGHQLANKTTQEVLYLEVGDRSSGDSVYYPDDDIQVVDASDGKRQFQHKSGIPY
ncbi:MAG TPA: cupin domain-containing protein [Burkholderiaceae bacterium]